MKSVTTFLHRRHTWQPYQRLSQSVKHVIGQDAFSRIKANIRHDSHVRSIPRPSIVHATGINVLGLLKAESGLGEAARGIVRALDAVGIPSSLHDLDLGDIRKADNSLADRLSSSSPYDVSLVAINADFLSTVYKNKRSLMDDHYIIGQWTWELSQFPEKWMHAFNLIHELWVPSTFVQKAVEAVSPVPVFVMPHVVDRAPSEAYDRSHFHIPSDGFVFLTMFDFHSVFERKNPIGTIQAFKKASDGRTNTQLVIKCVNAERYPREFQQMLLAINHDPRITVMNGYITPEERLDLLNICDAFISLHRSEGFGLALAEAMFMSKPVIATNYSGSTDFMDASNSLPVDYRLTRLEKTYGPYARGSEWAEPNMDDAVRRIRQILDDPAEAEKRANTGKHTIRTHHSAHAVAALIQQRLKALQTTADSVPSL